MKRLTATICIFLFFLILFYGLSFFNLPDEVGTGLFLLVFFSFFYVIIETVRAILKAKKGKKIK